MKTKILIIAVILVTISCDSSDKLIGNWKAKNSSWKAQIVKENGKLFIIGGGIDRSSSKFKIDKNGDSYSILIPPISFPMKYNNGKLYFNDKEWIRQ